MLPALLAKPAEMTSLEALDSTGYLMLAAQVDGSTGAPSAVKRDLLLDLKGRVQRMRRDMFANVAVMSALHMPDVSAPPAGRAGSGQPSHPTPPPAPVPRYDVALLIQAPTVDAARWLTADPAFALITAFVRTVASHTRVALVHNVRPQACEFGPCTRRIYLLLNYIQGDQRELLPAWGWTHRGQLLRDAALCRPVRRTLAGYPGRLSAPTQPVLYGVA